MVGGLSLRSQLQLQRITHQQSPGFEAPAGLMPFTQSSSVCFSHNTALPEPYQVSKVAGERLLTSDDVVAAVVMPRKQPPSASNIRKSPA